MQDASRIRMGEVFQLHTKEVILVCSHCSEEFEYFTEFSLHAQEHLQQLWQQYTTQSEGNILNDGELVEITSIDPIDERGASTEAAPVAETSSIWIKSEIIDAVASGMEFWSEEPIKSEALPHNELQESTKSGKAFNCVVLTSADRYDELIKEHRTSTINTHRSLNTFRYKMLPMQIVDTPETRMFANFYTKPRKWTNRYVDGKRCMCPICQRPYTIKTFKQHMFTHCKTPSLQCPFCAKTILYPRLVQPHLRTHINYQVECYVCKDPFKDLLALRSHMRAKHTGHKYCLQCHKQFTQPSSFRNHMKSVHSIDVVVRRHFEPDDTSICRRSNFSTGSNETIAPAIAFCPVESIKTEMLPDDQPRVASGHALEDDGLSTAERYDLLVEEYHASTSNAQSLRMLNTFRYRMLPMQVADTGETRMFAKFYIKPRKCTQLCAEDAKRRVCPICGKPSTIKTFKQHMFTHSKAPSLQCPFCAEMIVYPRLVPAHLRTHVNYRVECYVCKYPFKDLHTLRCHMRDKHTGRNYCFQCDKQFPQSSSFKEHMKRMHSIDVVIKRYFEIEDKSTRRKIEKIESTASGIDFWPVEPIKSVVLPDEQQLDDGLTETGRYDKLIEEYNATTSNTQCLRMLNKFRFKMMSSIVADTPETRMLAKFYIQPGQCTKLDVDGKRHVCPICKKTLITDAIKHHIFTHSTAPLLQCRLCTEAILYPRLVLRHLQTHPNFRIECYICRHQPKNHFALKRHMREEHTGHTHCVKCDKHFAKTSRFVTHMRRMHPKSAEDRQPFAADTIDYRFGELPERTPSSWECYLCKKVFATRTALYNHKLRHRYDQRLCTICGKQFKNMDYLRRHMTLHNNDRSHACDLCEKAYTSRKYLLEHRKKKHNLFVGASCRLCSATFDRFLDRGEHMRTAHSKDEKQFRCSICGQAAATRSNLKKHMRVHEVKRFVECVVCQKKVHEELLEFHMRSHTDKPSFECTECDKVFFSSKCLRSHSLIHNKANSPVYKCDVCDKIFYQRSQCQKHRRRHPQSMPFYCKYCNLGFILANSVRVHEMAHERQKGEERELVD